jgi:Protein of unknown function (DUF1360)
MLKVTDQYFWNFVFLAFLAFLVVMATIILETEARLTWEEIGLLDSVLIVLSTWRLTRFLSSDSTTKFFREQFYDLKKTVRTYSLEVPATGPRRTILEVLLNPWNLSLGLGAFVTFVYLLTPYAVYPLVLLALSGVVALLEVAVNFFAQKSKGE